MCVSAKMSDAKLKNYKKALRKALDSSSVYNTLTRKFQRGPSCPGVMPNVLAQSLICRFYVYIPMQQRYGT